MLQFCPQCGTVYMKGVAHTCVQACCEGSHEWCPPPLEDIPVTPAEVQFDEYSSPEGEHES